MTGERRRRGGMVSCRSSGSSSSLSALCEQVSEGRALDAPAQTDVTAIGGTASCVGLAVTLFASVDNPSRETADEIAASEAPPSPSRGWIAEATADHCGVEAMGGVPELVARP